MVRLLTIRNNDLESLSEKVFLGVVFTRRRGRWDNVVLCVDWNVVKGWNGGVAL